MLSDVWGEQYRGSSHYIHTYLRRLRNKLGDNVELLETVPGMGYSLLSKRTFKPIKLAQIEICGILIKSYKQKRVSIYRHPIYKDGGIFIKAGLTQ